MSKSPSNRLVADIGGTNSRLGLYDPVRDELRSLRTYINRDYAQFEDIVRDWLQVLPEPRPGECCLAIAAPPFDDRVSMINMDWSFSLSAMARRFGFTQLRGINDFEGNAYALPHLDEQDLTVLQPGRNRTGAKLATVGPGTGLGGATLSWAAGTAVACASEPGHMGLTPASELELELFRYFSSTGREVYAELLVSGPGLQRLYQAIGAIQGREIPVLSPAEISARAQGNDCELCTLSLNTFCALLGSICGDYVLANGAYGGLYLAGGILPRMIKFLEQSAFVKRFQEKGKMQPHLAQVPVTIITSEVTGLIGAAHAPTCAA